MNDKEIKFETTVLTQRTMTMTHNGYLKLAGHSVHIQPLITGIAFSSFLSSCLFKMFYH